MASVVAVHGIGNLKAGLSPQHAGAALADPWQDGLARGYAAAGLHHEPVPRLVVAYYAHLLAPGGEQGSLADLDGLDPGELRVARSWLNAAGVPDPGTAQGFVTWPLRQAVDWLAARRMIPQEVLGRVVVAFAREVYAYLTHPGRRAVIQQEVLSVLRAQRPQVVLAHSLGSVVTYEALHREPHLDIELLVTLGSPLGLTGAVFDALDPEPREGRGSRPPGVRRWVNLADPGDLVALPRYLGNRFPVDQHEEPRIGLVDFHTMGGYLANGMTAAAIAPYVAS